MSDDELKRWVRGLSKRGVQRRYIAETLGLTLARVTYYLRERSDEKSWRGKSEDDPRKSRSVKMWQDNTEITCREIAESVGASESAVSDWVNTAMGPGAVALRSRANRKRIKPKAPDGRAAAGWVKMGDPCSKATRPVSA